MGDGQLGWKEGNIRVVAPTPEDAILDFETVMLTGAIRRYFNELK